MELLNNCIFLINAGHETTTNLIGNSVHLLLEHPDSWHDLTAHPELVAGAVEEFLRMETSNQLGNRRATCGTEIGGSRSRSHTHVHLCIGAASADHRSLPAPRPLGDSAPTYR